jgi:hypothetical protein
VKLLQHFESNKIYKNNIEMKRVINYQLNWKGLKQLEGAFFKLSETHILITHPSIFNDLNFGSIELIMVFYNSLRYLFQKRKKKAFKNIYFSLEALNKFML